MKPAEKTIYCPLSGSDNTVLLENLDTKALLTLYQRQLSIDITSEVGDLERIGFYHCLDSDLKFFYPSLSGSEGFYEQLQQIDWYYLQEKFEYDYVKRFLSRKDRVLEVGCGSGLFAQQLSVNEYCGLEFSRKAQMLAQQIGVKVICESIQSHSHQFHHYYDVVCAFQVLEHITPLDEFIRACLHCLRPGGFLIYSVPSADSFLSVAKNNLLNMPPHHVSWWSDKALRYIGGKFNLEIIDIKHETLAEFHKVPYLSTILLEGLNQRLKLGLSLLNQSCFYRILAKSSNLIASYLTKGVTAANLFANGHSVIAVYRKENN